MGGAGGVFAALEHSAFGAYIRESFWVYPLANTGHILALLVFFAAVAVMDLRLLGAFPATTPASVVLPARRVAMAALAVQAATGFILFTAEASHIIANVVFLAKLALIATGLVNIFVVARLGEEFRGLGAGAPIPRRLRIAAGASLGIWFTVAGLGRLIAYA